jgi:hypothetical protein
MICTECRVGVEYNTCPLCRKESEITASDFAKMVRRGFEKGGMSVDRVLVDPTGSAQLEGPHVIEYPDDSLGVPRPKFAIFKGRAEGTYDVQCTIKL